MVELPSSVRRVLAVTASLLLALGISLVGGNLWISYSNRLHAYDTGRNMKPCT